MTAMEPSSEVNILPTAQLDDSQPIFDSFAVNYTGFDEWLHKVKEDPRRVLLTVEAADGEYEAVALLKPNELDNNYRFIGSVMKLSTFKVAEAHEGKGHGRKLFDMVMKLATDSATDILYVEVFPAQVTLISFLTGRGFQITKNHTVRGETVLCLLS